MSLVIQVKGQYVDIIGKKIAAVPYLGFPISYAKTTPGLILLVIIPAVIIIYDEMQKIKKENC